MCCCSVAQNRGAARHFDNFRRTLRDLAQFWLPPEKFARLGAERAIGKPAPWQGGRSGIPSRSCHIRQTSWVNNPAGAFSKYPFGTPSAGTYLASHGRHPPMSHKPSDGRETCPDRPAFVPAGRTRLLFGRFARGQMNRELRESSLRTSGTQAMLRPQGR